MNSSTQSGTSMTAAASRATCAVGDERTASRIVDVLTENFDDSDVAIAAFEQPNGRWDVTMYFAAPPDEAVIREMILLAAGESVADTVTFGTVEAKDWVRSGLEGLVPVSAGRFVVHGHHDRDRVPVNKLRIEIEAALAFGTGHHGTTRGCLVCSMRCCAGARPSACSISAQAPACWQLPQQRLCIVMCWPAISTRARSRSRGENAGLNGVGNLVETICATGFHSPRFAAEGPFGLVLANILAAPLRKLAPQMAAHLARPPISSCPACCRIRLAASLLPTAPTA